MLFKIGDKVYDPKEVPCAIVFANDEEKQHVIDILQNMPPKENAVRWYSVNPHDYFTAESFDKWAELTEQEKQLMRPNLQKPAIEI
jgi:hypothetical protein